MKSIPVIPIVSLLATAILCGLSYYETLPIADKVLLGSLFVTVATSFAYWCNPCPVSPQDEQLGNMSSKPATSFFYPEDHLSAKSGVNPTPILDDKVIVLVHKMSPQVEFLHLEPAPKTGDSQNEGKTIEEALMNVSKVMGIELNEFKLNPDIAEEKTPENAKITLKYRLAEIPAKAQLDLKPYQFQWLNIDDSLKKVQGNKELEEVLANFAVKLGLKKTKDQDLDEIRQIEQAMSSESADSKNKQLLWRVIEKKNHHFSITKTYSNTNRDDQPSDDNGKDGFWSWLFQKNKSGKCMFPMIPNLDEGLSNGGIIISVVVVILVIVAVVLTTYYLKPELFKG